MQAIILAAGKSTRTYPLTITKPKPLLKIAGRSIIEHNLEQLEEIVNEVIIVIGHKGSKIKEKLGNKFGKLIIKYAEQKVIDGNAGALLAAKDLIKNRFIVMNGDDLYSAKDIKKCLKHTYCVLVKYLEDISRFGEVIYKNNKVKDFREKPGRKEGLAYTGLMVLDKDVFRHEIKKSERGEYEIVDYISKLASEEDVYFERVEDYWIAISYPWNLLKANEFLMKKIKRKIWGELENNAVIKGNVFIGKNTIVKSGAYIEGPVFIGEDCTIGPNCYLRANCVIGNKCKIGNGVEIKNSIIGNNSNVPHLSYIGDSVIGDNVNIGAGTIVANLRHDNNSIRTPVKGMMVDSGRRKLGAIIGDNVKLGIKTLVYPGRKIWPDKTTVPGEIVKKDIL